MTWYEWIWATIGVVLFFVFLLIFLMASLMNFTTGSAWGGFVVLVIAAPLAVIISATWPLWLPFTFILDVRNDMKNKV